MTRRPDSEETPYGWWVVGASFAIVAIGNASQFITAVALKPIASELGWARIWPALGYSVGMLGAGVGAILMGRWSDRVGVWRPVTVGVLSIAAGCLVISASESRATYLLAHGLLIGLLGNAAIFGPLVSNITKWFDRRRGLAVAIVTSGQTLAGAVWTPIFRYYVDTLGWRLTFAHFAVLVAVTLIPVSVVLRRNPPASPIRGGARDAGSRLRALALGMRPSATLGWLCFAIVGCCVSMSIPLVHLVAHATDLGFTAARGAELLSAALACGLVSRITWGLASDQVGGLKTLFMTSSIQAIAMLAFAATQDLPNLFAVAVLFGLGYGGVVPSYAVLIREHFDSDGVGMRLGIIVLFGTIGMALGGWLAAQIFDLNGTYRYAFLVGFAFNLANLAVVGFLLRQQLVARAGPRLSIPPPWRRP